jgi:antibiotic biosynthesis monooxygenase (ABM) superfamily enzyme
MPILFKKVRLLFFSLRVLNKIKLTLNKATKKPQIKWLVIVRRRVNVVRLELNLVIVTFTNSVKYSAVNTTSLLKKTSQNCHLIAYFVLPNGTKSQPSQVLSFVARTI